MSLRPRIWAPPYKFESMAEIENVLSLIKESLRVYSGMMDIRKSRELRKRVYQKDQGAVEVCFTPDLLLKIKNGELLK
jgi:hypothetical protein